MHYKHMFVVIDHTINMLLDEVIILETRLCIPFFFRFLTGLIFRNPQISADYFRFRGTHVGIKSFQGKINLFRNPPESGIRPESGGKDP